MDSDSDVDLSWVELAAEADARPLKRSLTPSPQLGDREAKRSGHEAGPELSDTSFEETRDEIKFQAAPSSTEWVEDTKLENRGVIMVAQLGVPSRPASEPTELKLPSIRLTSGYMARLERAANPTREVRDMELHSGTIPMEQRGREQFEETGVMDLSASDDEDTLEDIVKDSDVTETKSMIVVERNACDCYDCRTNPSTRLMGSGRHSGITDHAGRLLLRKRDGRPFAEPPSFDYETFEKEHVPSDKMIRDMFPDGPEGRTAYRDAQTENELLKMFDDWTISTREDENKCVAKDCTTCRFHSDLRAELRRDLQIVGDEFDVIQTSLDELQLWQKNHLDMDGELQFARGQLDVGRNIFDDPGGREAWVKYGHRLEPIPADDLSVWELCHLGGKGKLGSQAYSYYDKTLGDHGDLFTSKYFGGISAKEKYVAVFDIFRDTKLHEIKDRVLKGEDLFFGLVEAVSNAGYALFSFRGEWPGRSWPPKHDPKTWECLQLDVLEGIWHLQGLREDHIYQFEPQYFGAMEARSKWGYLKWEHENDLAIEDEVHKGVEVFKQRDGTSNPTCETWESTSARARYEHVLGSLGRPPKHDLETWEWFHIDESRGGIETTKKRLLVGEQLFDPCHFGGVEARAKWGYLKWEHENDLAIEDEVHNGVEVIKQRDGTSNPTCETWESTSARARYEHVLGSLERPPKHDLETWEWFHIDESRGGIETTKKRLLVGEQLFDPCYFGGVEARAKWGYLKWEHENDLVIEDEVHKGVEVFKQRDGTSNPTCETWESTSARARYEHVLGSLERPPKHDLETWEWFHIDESRGGIETTKKRLLVGEQLFDPCYFGGVEARAKWGYLVWDLEWLDPDGGTTDAEDALRGGRDIFIPRGWKTDDCPAWSGKSARVKYRHLLEKLSPRAKHDVETWDDFTLTMTGLGHQRSKKNSKTSRGYSRAHILGSSRLERSMDTLLPSGRKTDGVARVVS